MMRPRVSIGLLMGVVGLVAIDLSLTNFFMTSSGLNPAVLAAIQFAGMGNVLILAWFCFLSDRGRASRFLRAFMFIGTVIGLASLVVMTSLVSWVEPPFIWLAGYFQDFFMDGPRLRYTLSPFKMLVEPVTGVAFMVSFSALIALPQVILATVSAWFFSKYKIVRREAKFILTSQEYR